MATRKSSEGMPSAQERLLQKELAVVKKIEARVAHQKREMESLRRKIDRDENALAALTLGLNDYLHRREITVTPTGRLTRSAATAAKEQMGMAIYKFLLARHGKRFRRADIEKHLPHGCAYPWHKVMAYWDKAHDQTPIRNDAGATSARLYWV